MWLLWQSWCVFMTWWTFYALLILITIDQFLKSIPYSLVTWNIPVRFFSMDFFLDNGSSRKSCSFGQSYIPYFGGTTSLPCNPLPASLHSWTPPFLELVSSSTAPFVHWSGFASSAIMFLCCVFILLTSSFDHPSWQIFTCVCHWGKVEIPCVLCV